MVRNKGNTNLKVMTKEEHTIMGSKLPTVHQSSYAQSGVQVSDKEYMCSRYLEDIAILKQDLKFR